MSNPFNPTKLSPPALAVWQADGLDDGLIAADDAPDGILDLVECGRVSYQFARINQAFSQEFVGQRKVDGWLGKGWTQANLIEDQIINADFDAILTAEMQAKEGDDSAEADYFQGVVHTLWWGGNDDPVEAVGELGLDQVLDGLGLDLDDQVGTIILGQVQASLFTSGLSQPLKEKENHVPKPRKPPRTQAPNL